MLSYFMGLVLVLRSVYQVVESVVVVNPGPLSKRKGAGTYSQMTIYPRKLSEEEATRGDLVAHDVFHRARVDIVRI